MLWNHSRDLLLIKEGKHWDPHSVLGLHSLGDKQIIRIYRPGAAQLYIEVQGSIFQATKIDDSGIFEYSLSEKISHLDYRIYLNNGRLAHDPYAFSPLITKQDQELFSKGILYNSYDLLGSTVTEVDSVYGVLFSVWAPNAIRVSVVGDFNFWDGRINMMRNLGDCGLWEIFIPGIGEGDKYKFEIIAKDNQLKLKSDPYGHSFEKRPLHASVITDINKFDWTDKAWISSKKEQDKHNKPFNIYEVHIGSWKAEKESFLNYRELAVSLTNYCIGMGFTHVEILPIQEHPLDESWGYQITGYFGVTSRYGSVQDFQYFVNYLHEHNIGVILDWVPGHFPTDDFALREFDGTCLYEHKELHRSMHPHWGTLEFNYSRKEVVGFLISSALFFLDKMHIDGLRVDAVASMLYLDYGRKDGDWIPNIYGGKENLEAIDFIKHLNSIVHIKHPTAIMIAEESTAFNGVTKSVADGGLGFDYKWNMGWMNDTLSYFKTDPLFRKYDHNKLTFGIMYAFSENFILVLSHDEVVHGKGSLVNKMPGEYWEKFANLRLLLSYIICQPGKKLIFMGNEIAQWDEWNVKSSIQWDLLNFDSHKGIQQLVKDLNFFYLNNKELWNNEINYDGFEWVDFQDQEKSIISYKRKALDGSFLVCVHNFTPNSYDKYELYISNATSCFEVFNTDSSEYWGSGMKNEEISVNIVDNGINIIFKLPSLSTIIFKTK